MVESPLSILQINSTDMRGGAEKVAWNLFRAYRARGHPSWLAVGEKRSEDPDVIPVPNEDSRSRIYLFCRDLSARIQQRSRVGAFLNWFTAGVAHLGSRMDALAGIEDFRYPGTARLIDLAPQRPDILHAHNLHGGYFDLRELPRLSRQVPWVLTLHDAWLLSGHCAHSVGCERWQTGCGHCPDLSLYPAIQRDATAYNWRRKRDIFAQSRLYVAAPSRWLMDKIERSMLVRGIVEMRVVPNGIDLAIFHPPKERYAARVALGITDERFILVTTGVELRRNRWKDYATLHDALHILADQLPNRLPGQRVVLIALGDDAPGEQIGLVDIRPVPFEAEAQRMALAYGAADLYVHATRADTFPTSVLEALACGAPVVGSKVGGIPEQVEEGRTGFLTPAGDAKAMAERIQQLMVDHALRQAMSAQAAERARCRFSLDRQVDSYLQWYEEMARSHAHSGPKKGKSK